MVVKGVYCYLFGYEVVQEVDRRRLEEKIVWDRIVEETWVVMSQATHCDEQRQSHGDRQVHRECITESLDHNLTRKLSCKGANVNSTTLSYSTVSPEKI